jgi:hypothetical protein
MFKKIIFVSILSGITYSTFSQAPKYSNEFLSIGVGARALGMAGAQVATVNDVTSGFWNPAGLCLTRGDLQVALMHNEYFAGIGKFDYGAIAAPIDETRTVGLSVIRFAIDDIIDSTELIDADGNINYERLKSFSAADYAFLFSYSKKAAMQGLRYGGNFKVIHRKLGPFASAWGFGLDVGAQYEKNKWKFGAFGKDVTSTFNAWTFNTEQLATVFEQTNNEIPENGLEITLPKLILGVGYNATISQKFTLQPEVNLDVTFDGKRNVVIKGDPISIDPHIGLELGYANFIYLRGGIWNVQTVKDIDGGNSTIIQPTMGVGLKIKNLTIDYALTNLGKTNDQIYSNIFSLNLSIFKVKKNIQPDKQTN